VRFSILRKGRKNYMPLIRMNKSVSTPGKAYVKHKEYEVTEKIAHRFEKSGMAERINPQSAMPEERATAEPSGEKATAKRKTTSRKKASTQKSQTPQNSADEQQDNE
jgi:hypothetical protein